MMHKALNVKGFFSFYSILILAHVIADDINESMSYTDIIFSKVMTLN